AALEPRAFRRGAARRGQRSSGVHLVRQRRALRRPGTRGRAHGAEIGRRAGGLVCVGGSQVRTAPALWRLHGGGEACAGAPEERRSAPYDFSWVQTDARLKPSCYTRTRGAGRDTRSDGRLDDGLLAAVSGDHLGQELLAEV